MTQKHGDKKCIDGIWHVWNSFAINYDEGVDYVDVDTELWYSEEELKHVPVEVRKRVTVRGRSFGAWVLDV